MSGSSGARNFPEPLTESLKAEDVQEKISADKVNTQKSRKKGVWGVIETVLRQFQNLAFVSAILPLAVLYVFCLAFALFPGVYLSIRAFSLSASAGLLVQASTVALALGMGAVLFIVGLLFIVPIANLPIKPFVKPYRGPWFSLESIPWMYHNSLMYLVRYTVLDLVTPSPLATWFLKGMGMKIGKGSLVNTSNISDPCLIQIEDYVTVGGSVYMMAHYGMKGFLIIDRLVVKRKANVGLHAYLMGAVVIEEGAQVLPNTMVLPKTIVPAGQRYSNYP